MTARYAYDPFGKRRTTSGNYDAAGNLVVDWNNVVNSGTDRGYTGHEHLDDVGVIHMNGRLFDPRLGVFMQGDPYIQDPSNLQNYNRYAYCYNNPLTCTDPTGQLSLFGHRILPGLFNSKNIRIVASIAAAYFLGPGGMAWGEWGVLGGLGITNPLAQAAVAGFVSGSISSGDLKGGVQGAFSAGMFYGAGNIIGGGNFFTGGTGAGLSFGEGVALHAVVGCVTSEAGGSNCGSGALSAAFSKGALQLTMPSGSNGLLGGTVISAVIGGSASVLGGGKFSNGASTAAFGYLFNCGMHPGSCMRNANDPAKKAASYHEYELDYDICSFDNSKCTMKNAMEAGTHFPTPQADGSAAISNGEKSIAEVPTFLGAIPIGRVVHFVDYQNNAIFNITLNDHLLAPGYVYINFYETSAGIRMRLYGEGTGILPRTNESRAPITWGGVAERIRERIGPK